ncbi:MAG: DNA-binding protein [candidate division Zixibacteria bacterium]|nr:DNA-binding protein [candidate division Zixibacteria bacterium]
MKSFKIKNGYLLRLDKGEEVVSSINKFAEKSNITTASINAIGAVTNCVLGFFDREKKTYLNRDFNDVYELVSLNGNITFFDGKPILHSHIAIGDKQCKLYGGHFFSGTVAVTAEIFILETGVRIVRSLVDELGLNLIDSEENV